MGKRLESVGRCRVVERNGRWVLLIDNEPRLVLPEVVMEQRGPSRAPAGNGVARAWEGRRSFNGERPSPPRD